MQTVIWGEGEREGEKPVVGPPTEPDVSDGWSVVFDGWSGVSDGGGVAFDGWGDVSDAPPTYPGKVE